MLSLFCALTINRLAATMSMPHPLLPFFLPLLSRAHLADSCLVAGCIVVLCGRQEHYIMLAKGDIEDSKKFVHFGPRFYAEIGKEKLLAAFGKLNNSHA